jgi:hypothetical protein
LIYQDFTTKEVRLQCEGDEKKETGGKYAAYLQFIQFSVFIELVSKVACHSEGAFAPTDTCPRAQVPGRVSKRSFAPLRMTF